jgi:hypothetical protein
VDSFEARESTLEDVFMVVICGVLAMVRAREAQSHPPHLHMHQN